MPLDRGKKRKSLSLVLDSGRTKARVIGHLQATHEVACYISCDYKGNRILQYLKYRWNLLVREVQYGRHANLYQESSHTNNTYHAVFSTGHRVVERYGVLGQRVFVLFALAHSHVKLHFHKSNGDNASARPKASHGWSGGTAFGRMLYHPYEHGNRDDYAYLPLPCVHDAISYFSGLPLPCEHDDTLSFLYLRSLYALDDIVYFSLATHPFDSDSVPCFSQIGTFCIVPFQQRSRRQYEEKIVCKNYIASEGRLEVEYCSWQSSYLCHHASGCYQHRRGKNMFKFLNSISLITYISNINRQYSTKGVSI